MQQAANTVTNVIQSQDFTATMSAAQDTAQNPASPARTQGAQAMSNAATATGGFVTGLFGK